MIGLVQLHVEGYTKTIAAQGVRGKVGVDIIERSLFTSMQAKNRRCPVMKPVFKR